MTPQDGAFELPGRRRRSGLSLAPLIDVTFILLIFFMLVTQFERFAPVDVTLGSDRVPPVTQPQSDSGAPKKLIISISADGTIRMGGEETLSLAELGAVLASETEIAPVADVPARTVAIAPEPDVPLQLLLEVMSVVEGQAGAAAQLVVPRDADTRVKDAEQ